METYIVAALSEVVRYVCCFCPNPITPLSDWRFVAGGKAHRYCAAPGEQPRG